MITIDHAPCFDKREDVCTKRVLALLIYMRPVRNTVPYVYHTVRLSYYNVLCIDVVKSFTEILFGKAFCLCKHTVVNVESVVNKIVKRTHLISVRRQKIHTHKI